MVREWQNIKLAPTMRITKDAEQIHSPRYVGRLRLIATVPSKTMTKLKWIIITTEWLKSISQAVARSCLSALIVLICKHIPIVNTIPNIANPMNVAISSPSETSQSAILVY